MARQRSVGTDYSRHTIEDRPEETEVLRMTDEDGNIIDVGEDNPLPVDSTLNDKLLIEDVKESLESIDQKMSKILIYMEEAMNLGLVDNGEYEDDH